MNIEPASEKDITSLQNISQTAIAGIPSIEHEAISSYVAHTAKNIEQYIGSSDCVFLKSTVESKLIGYILVKEFWNLSDLFVLPEYQRHGAGSKLLVDALEICKRYGVGYVRLNSALHAVPFYRKFGFKKSNSHTSKHDSAVALELKF